MARTASGVRLRRLAGAAAVTLGLLAGCAPTCGLGYRHKAELPPEVTPQPLGTFAHGWQEAQAAKAEASDFAFYLDEWYMGGKYLGPSGVSHLRQVIHRLPTEPFPVVIQPHEDEALNLARRQFIVEALMTHGIIDAERRVIIETPIAEGLHGDEAERIYYQMISPNQNWRGLNNNLSPFQSRPYGGLGLGAGFAPGFLSGFLPGTW